MWLNLYENLKIFSGAMNEFILLNSFVQFCSFASCWIYWTPVPDLILAGGQGTRGGHA